jgi:uncharacterized OsmC-like protein
MILILEARMIQYPLTFSARSELSSGISSPWRTSVPHLGVGLVTAVPIEFEGPGGGYSPEDFYALALLNCFGATFTVIAERSRLTYETLSLHGVLTVDRDAAGSPWMKHFVLSAVLKSPSDRERATRLLEKTSQSCLILNSVKTEKEFRFEIR